MVLISILICYKINYYIAVNSAFTSSYLILIFLFSLSSSLSLSLFSPNRGVSDFNTLVNRNNLSCCSMGNKWYISRGAAITDNKLHCSKADSEFSAAMHFHSSSYTYYHYGALTRTRLHTCKQTDKTRPRPFRHIWNLECPRVYCWLQTTIGNEPIIRCTTSSSFGHDVRYASLIESIPWLSLFLFLRLVVANLWHFLHFLALFFFIDSLYRSFLSLLARHT